jgi:hypothetical protein
VSAESDALSAAIQAAKQFKDGVEATLRQQPPPPAATLNAASSAVSASTTQLQNLLNAFEASAAVAAKAAQDSARTSLLNNFKLLTDKIKAVEQRFAEIAKRLT